MDKQQVLAILGPTGIGKTDLAILLQEEQKWPIEIISVDSVMIYKDCRIGCAKPCQETLNKHPHHLIDLCDYHETYDVHRFLLDAKKAIIAIQERGNIPCLVGGTMMYFYAAKYGLANIPPIDSSIREKIREEGVLLGWPKMWEKLNAVDPCVATKIKPNDAQRLERALSVYQAHKKPLSSFWQEPNIGAISDASWRWLTLYPESREALYQQVNKRFDNMMEQGVVDEVKALYAHKDCVASGIKRAVGYRQIWDFLSGNLDEKDMVDKGKQATRHLVKRQLTWMHNQFQDEQTKSVYIAQKETLKSQSKKLYDALSSLQ